MPLRQHRIHRNATLNILGLVVTTDEIVHDIRVPDTLSDLFLITNVPFLPKAHRVKTKLNGGQIEIETHE